MKTYLSALKKSAGFTLIELLVVIGVLGILAAGLLATIDPLEQFRKGSDSNSKQTALELQNGLVRYYATHQAMPWATVANGGVACAGAAGTLPAATQVSGASAASATFGPCLDALIADGELKTVFKTQYAILKNLYVTDTTSGTSINSGVCYDPTSKSESLRAETVYNADHNPLSAACVPSSSNLTCNWCAQ